MHTFTGRADVAAVLTDPTFVVPPEPSGPGAMAWLRAHVARFSTGEEHARRRRLATELLDALDPTALRTAAREAARAGTPPERIPTVVLTAALGLPGTADLVATAASGYLPGGTQGPAVDAAVTALRTRLTGPDEAVAARIGVLLQAHNATAALIRAAATRGGDVEAAVGEDPPARTTRRVATEDRQGVAAGTPVTLNLATATLPWGAGAHECPGRVAALALAAGALTP
jgi:hypothetical protein